MGKRRNIKRTNAPNASNHTKISDHGSGKSQKNRWNEKKSQRKAAWKPGKGKGKVQKEMKDEARNLVVSSSNCRSGSLWERQTRADNRRETQEGILGYPENQKMRKLYKTHSKRKGNSKKYWTILKELERQRTSKKTPGNSQRDSESQLKTSREGRGSGNGKRTNEG